MSPLLGVLLFTQLIGAMGWPDGPPYGVCRSMEPVGHEVNHFSSTHMRFRIETSAPVVEENGVLDITVFGPVEIKGIFIQVRDESGRNIVGKFNRPSSDGFKLMDCFDKSDSAFAHADGDPKGKAVTARWVAPDSCDETYTVRATVVVNFSTFETGLSHEIDCIPSTSEK